ncbi:MAG: class I SAM-dependent methyltransferase [Rhodospirillales bacterium]|nr:class I SAM-dependent methyltransferase [Rhodospirillales bacterium]
MPLSNVEYVALRLVRKFLFTDASLMRIGRLLPYYQANIGMQSPYPIVQGWGRALGGAEPYRGVRILELGSGATNSAAYCLASQGAERVYAVEPFRSLDAAADSIALRTVAADAGCVPDDLAARVARIGNVEDVDEASIDLVVSHSVLEHLSEPEAVLRSLDRVLAPGGCMCHAVDFRDHFFKYPFHFLQFEKHTWTRWLDPGDLPRWRLSDYLRLFDKLGYRAEVPVQESDAAGYAKIRDRVSKDFDRDDPTMSVTLVTLVARRAA